MSFYGVLRDLERAAKAAERERVRREKEIYRINLANQKAYEKQRKQQYLESRQEEADRKTKEILNQYNNYDTFLKKVLSSPKFLCIDSMKKEYIPQEFTYKVAVPQKNNYSENIRIPKESKLENKIVFLKNRRLSKIAQKEEMQKEEEKDYEIRLEQYEKNKEIALNYYKMEEKKKEEEINKYNQLIEKWKNDCIKYDKNSIDKYMAHMINFLVTVTNDKLISKLQYSLNNRNLICEIHLKKEQEIFPCEGYRYYKQKDVIEKILTKKVTMNSMLKEMIPNIAIAFTDILYKNDELNLFDNVIVNVFYERKCCSSLMLSKDDYFNFDLKNEDSYYFVIDHYMKIYKVITTGVKPYDSIYLDLV